MNKRTIYTLMAVLWVNVLPFGMLAESKAGSTQYPTTSTQISVKPVNKNLRPKMPSRQQIECWYDGESLTFDFAIPEGECTLTVTDASTAMQAQYVFDTETTAEVYVGPMAEAYLELYTSTGHCYEGQLGE